MTLANEGGDGVRPFLFNELFQLPDQLVDELAVGEPFAVAVLIGGADVDVARHAGAETFVIGGDAGGGQGAHGNAVIAHPAGDDFDLLRLAVQPPVVASDLQGGFVRLGAAGSELDVVQIAGEHAGQLGRQLDRRRRAEAEEGGHKGEFLHLLRRDLGQPVVTEKYLICLTSEAAGVDRLDADPGWTGQVPRRNRGCRPRRGWAVGRPAAAYG